MRYLKSILYFIIIGLCGLYACNFDSGPIEVNSINEYNKVMKDKKSDLEFIKEIDDYSFRVAYIPSDLIIIRNSSNEHITELDIEKQRNNYKNQLCFDFVISNKKMSGEDMLTKDAALNGVYDANVSYFSFHIENDIYLLDGDKKFVALFFFSRDYGRNSGLNFFVVFDLGRDKKDFMNNENIFTTFVYNDTYFGIGKVKINIEKKQLQNTPIITIKQ